MALHSRRFDRIDNGKMKWFDIDFPEVIELRRRFMKENDRRCFHIRNTARPLFRGVEPGLSFS